MSSKLFAALLGLALSCAAYGQDFPTRPIRILATAPGGASDVAARAMGKVVGERLRQPVVVENAAGRAALLAARAQPDGYTLLIEGRSFWVAALMQPLPFDPVKDFAPITETGTSIYILAINPSLQANNVRELVALAKSRPGSLSFGSSSVGSTPHLGMELFKSMTATDMVHVPYKESAAVMRAVVAGEIHMAFFSGTSAIPNAKAGKVRLLGIANKTPSALVKDLPLITDAGVPGFELTQLLAMFAPAGTPVPRINLLNQEFRFALDTAEVKERMLTIGLEPKSSTPQELEAVLKNDLQVIGKLVKDLNIKVN